MPTPRKARGGQRRTCLRCDARFASDGPQNRLCPTCRQVLAQRESLPEPTRLATQRAGPRPRAE